MRWLAKVIHCLNNINSVSYTHLTLPTTDCRRVDLGGRRVSKKKKKKNERKRIKGNKKKNKKKKRVKKREKEREMKTA
ncbi:hypothetical protein, partial [Escherichia coli]|uniref:hypothetical protein n=1 Tax=Escherichia coli TaxID=562 RepID=UPI001BC87A8E